MDYPSDREVLETCECDEPVSVTCVCPLQSPVPSSHHPIDRTARSYTYKLVAKAAVLIVR